VSEEQNNDGAAVRFPPPFVPLIALAAGFATSWLAGPLPDPLPAGARLAAGGILLAAGIAFMILAMGLFRRTGQDPKPWKSSPELIGTGVYRWTRNPMYLGMGLLQAGLGLLFANLWVVALVPVTWLVIYRIAIRHEEAYLEAKFGASYLDYKQAVRRWL
jgi:protein-S-isoprenylcysteine O-methyltransferase Ste14